MSLYRDVRPTDFQQVVGNEAAIEFLTGLMAKPADKRPHAFMISGPSGTGKTTIARILARKFLGADDLSIHEVNSSDNRGIDTARDIQQKMQFVPATGGVMVFIIDECHKATNEWQNAMLKPLEDTPAHVYFFLCTTEPEKMIKAVHTRCTKVQLSALPQEDIFRLVWRTIKSEKLNVAREIADLIAENADGSPRQALVLLEMAAAAETPEAQREAVSMPVVEEAETIELCRSLLSGAKWPELAKSLEKLKSMDSEKVRRAVMGYMQAVLLKSGKSRAGVVMEIFSQNTYDNGFTAITLMTYQACHAE